MEAVVVPVATHHDAYNISIAPQLLARAGEVLRSLLPKPNAIVVTDDAVAPLYLHRLTNALAAADIRVQPVIIPHGEASKNLGQFTQLLEKILALNPDRNTTLIALGGGVVGDITGFAASVVLRGVPFVQIPTTLLAQVDSSVGGKTGVNTAYGKNVVGTFYQPKAVLIDVDTLSTLPPRELKAGYAEVVKYGLINDAQWFDWCEQHGHRVLEGDTDARLHAIAYSCRAKAKVVAADEKEQSGVRALLNLGHTFGHALEAETGYSDTLLHGEGVAIGMVLAAKLSERLGLAPAQTSARIEAHLRAVGLPVGMQGLGVTAQAMMMHMAHDKKADAGSLTFVLMHALGQSVVAKGVDRGAVQSFIEGEL